MKQEKVDVAIIGSGMGGLSAAALLAHGGYKILVVEKLPRIGGRFATIDYQGFKFCTGAIVVQLGGEFEQIFKEVGADFNIRRVPPVVYRIRGKDYEMPAKGGLTRILEIACDNEAESRKVLTALRRAMTWQVPSSRCTFREWILQYTHNEEILELFNGLLSAMLGGSIDELPPSEFAHFMIAAGGVRDHALPPQGPSALAQSLAKVIQDKGSAVWTRCPAKRILISNQMVRGVVVQKDGEEVEVSAKAVISNTGPKRTVELAGSENFDKGYLRELKEKTLPMRGMWIHIASEKPLTEHVGGIIFTRTRRLRYALCPSHICPEHAPPGMHLLVVGGPPAQAFLPVDFKKEIECIIQDVRENFPDFDKYGKVLMTSVFDKDWPVIRNWPGYILPQKTPVELLYNVGDAVVRSGMYGAHGAAESGKMVVEDLKKRIQPRGV